MVVHFGSLNSRCILGDIMHSTFDVLWLLIGVWPLYAIIQEVSRTLKRDGRPSWIVVAMWLLALVGCTGFFVIGAVSAGILKVSNSFEWPAGYVKGVATMANGNQVVPLESSGRLQLYDPKWKFLRGWHIEAFTGDFKVECPPDGMIRAYTAKGHHLYTFTEKGELVSSTKYDGDFEALPSNDSYVAVPTSLAGWPFSRQFISLGLCVLALLGLAIVEKIVRGRAMTDKSQPAK